LPDVKEVVEETNAPRIPLVLEPYKDNVAPEPLGFIVKYGLKPAIN
jgi:hypothetical protein